MTEFSLDNNDVQLVCNEGVPSKRRRVSNDQLNDLKERLETEQQLTVDELKLKVKELEQAKIEINNLKARHAKELEKFASMEKSYKRIEILFNGSANKIFKLEQENCILKKELNTLKQTEKERILMQLKADESVSASTSQSISNEQLETFIEKGRQQVECINKQKSAKTSVNEQLKKIITEHKNSSNKAKSSKDYIGALENIYTCIGIQLNSLVDKNQLSSLWNLAGQVFVEMNK
ncbi:hypothetical protein M3Y97_00726800 [Aphelenchoides bicaudatus]|nr:hypothetical protein M3Y97_00726800 [Aphelenchoides bicaudatus]